MSLDGKEMAKQLIEGFFIAMQLTLVDLPGDFDIALWMLLAMIGLVVGVIYAIRKLR